MKESIKRQLQDSIAVKEKILADEALLSEVEAVVRLCAAALARGNKILIAGNGGSAADAQHIAAEFVGRFKMERRALPAIALTTDTSLLTAVGNDYGFEEIFARQVAGLAQAGDVFIGISTSGNSANVLKALAECATRDVTRVGLAGGTGGKMVAACDHLLLAPSADTPRIQESHITLGHILCDLIDHELFA